MFFIVTVVRVNVLFCDTGTCTIFHCSTATSIFYSLFWVSVNVSILTVLHVGFFIVIMTCGCF